MLGSLAQPLSFSMASVLPDHKEYTWEKALFKTRMCTLWLDGCCSRRRCAFAHGAEELNQRPDLQETTMCSFEASCRKRRACRFAHSTGELRCSETFPVCMPMPVGHQDRGVPNVKAHNTGCGSPTGGCSNPPQDWVPPGSFTYDSTPQGSASYPLVGSSPRNTNSGICIQPPVSPMVFVCPQWIPMTFVLVPVMAVAHKVQHPLQR